MPVNAVHIAADGLVLFALCGAPVSGWAPQDAVRQSKYLMLQAAYPDFQFCAACVARFKNKFVKGVDVRIDCADNTSIDTTE